MRHDFDLSIVIPAYNEAQRIEPTLRSIDTFLAASDLTYEIVVVDDGSADDTVALVDQLTRELPFVRCIATRPNRGKGHAVRVGMLASRGAVRLMCDADGSIPAAMIPTVVNPLRLGQADIAIGSRYVGGASFQRKQPWYRRWWSRIANRVVQRTLVGGIQDTQCGFKAFTAQAADQIFCRTLIDGWAFDLEALALARRMGFHVTECGVTWSDDPRSKINPIRDAINVVRELITIRSNLKAGVYGRLGPVSGPA
jgi:glycosyltransferase involved in cell wall biosynthesis